jgi:signal transduction histidine kinase
VILAGLLTIVATISLFLYNMGNIFSSLIEIYQIDPDIAASLQSSIYSTALITLGLGFLFTVLTFVFVVVLTHRYVGPSVAMKRVLNELASGNYAVRGSLREKDEMKDLMEQINSLASTLEKKYESTSKTPQTITAENS